MKYTWIERDGYYCAASEWLQMSNEPEEYRLVFRIARAKEDNAYMLDCTLDFSGSELTFYKNVCGLHRTTRTGILGSTQAHEVERRAIPKPRVTRRRNKFGEIKVTNHEWRWGKWTPVVTYEAA